MDRKKYLITGYVSGIILLSIDFITKSLANSNLPLQETQKSVLPFVRWHLTHNTGYHFIFGNISNHALWATFGLVFVLYLLYSLSKSVIKENFSSFYIAVYSVLIALTVGATGNVVEILVAGHATDFFIFGPFPWPSNLCDQFINAIIYIIIPVIVIKTLIDRRRMKQDQSDWIV